MPAYRTRSIVTIRRDDVAVGVGFLVGRQRVVTCAHVVNAALGLDLRNQARPDKSFLVEFALIRGGVVRTAKVVFWVPPPRAGAAPDGPADIAGLELTEPAPSAAKPLRFATPKPHSAVDVYGYPSQPARPDGGWVEGILRHPVGSGLLQLDSRRDGALRAQPGFSGSPVLNRSRRVVGMLATASILPGQDDCYAIPPEWLSKAWPTTIVVERSVARPSWLTRTRLVGGAVGLVVVVALVALGIRAFSGASQDRTDCVPVNVSVSTEKDELLAELAESYNTSGRTFGDDTCARITTTGLTSGTAMEALAEGWPADKTEGRPTPQVWLPSTSMWADLLRQGGRGSLLAPGPLKSVTSSVLVIAMPNRMARAVREDRGEPGWRDILDLASNTDGWAEVGHGEWGPFVLGRDNPNFSSSGLAASVAMYFAAAGKDSGLTADDLGRAEVTATVRGIESSVLRYGNEATQFMRSLYEEDQGGDTTKPFVSAVLIQEQLVYLYNKGAPLGDLSASGPRPKQAMTAVYPEEGTVEFDHPYLTMASASVEQRMAAQDFYAFLLEDAQQQRFLEFGFRSLTDRHRPTEKLARTVGVSVDDRQRLFELPDPVMLEAIQDAWDGTRKSARVLLVLDVSESMNEPADNRNAAPDSKLDVLKPAAKRGLELLGDRDEVGVWTFNQSRTTLLPISPVAEVRPRLNKIIDSLTASGSTALHATLLAAKDEIAHSIDPARINAIVLLSDGKNHPEDPKGAAELLDRIAAENQETPVRIFTVPYGENADTDLLGKIADVTKAHFYDDATDPKNIDEVMVSVFSNFG